MFADKALLAMVVAACIACERREVSSDEHPDHAAANDTLASLGPVDSAAAVQLLIDALQARDPTRPPTKFQVAAFTADTSGYHITLFRDPVLPGGGGQARVTRSGAIRDLILFQ